MFRLKKSIGRQKYSHAPSRVSVRLALFALLALLMQRTLPPCDMFAPLLMAGHASDHQHAPAHPHDVVEITPHEDDSLPQHDHSQHDHHHLSADIEGGSNPDEPATPHPITECCSPAPEPVIVAASLRLLSPRLIDAGNDLSYAPAILPSGLNSSPLADTAHSRDGPATIDRTSQYISCLLSGRSPPLYL